MAVGKSADDLTKYFPHKVGNKWIYTVFSLHRPRELDSYFGKTNIWLIGSERYPLAAEYTIVDFPSLILRGKQVITKKVEMSRVYIFYFYATDDGGIYKYAEQSPLDPEPIIINFPEYEIKFPIKAGLSWECTEITNLLRAETPLRVKIKRCIESVNETVIVPAGVFENCLKVRSFGNTGKVKIPNPFSPIPLSATNMTIEQIS